MQPEAGLIAMFLGAPGKDPHLIEVKRQPRLGRTQQRQVLRNHVVRSLGVLVQHLGQHIRADNPLPLGVDVDLVRHIHIQASREHPAGVPLRIAHQPPILQYHLRWGQSRLRRGRWTAAGGVFADPETGFAAGGVFAGAAGAVPGFAGAGAALAGGTGIGPPALAFATEARASSCTFTFAASR